MNPRFFFKHFLLVVSLSSRLVSGPCDRVETKEKDFSPSRLQEEQRRLFSECLDWDDLQQDPRQATEGSSANVTAVDESLASSEQSTPLTKREQTLAQLGTAFRKAFSRGDENHSDWNRVDELIVQLYPSNPKSHRKRRFSHDPSEVLAAESKELEYSFFTATLPAIRKASVVAAALPRSNNFQTASIIEKAEEEQAWREAKEQFQQHCSESRLVPLEDGDSSMMEDDPNPYHDYIQKFDYHIARCAIERQLNALHHDIMQNIIKAKVITADFEERVSDKESIINSYQELLATIARKKATIPAAKDKWQQLEQEVAALALNDSTQVERIKLWKNRNQVNAIHKATERVQERAEQASHGDVGMQTWKDPLARENQAALDAWTERKNQLEIFQSALSSCKQKLQLNLPTQIEQEIETELVAAQQAIQHWRAGQAQK